MLSLSQQKKNALERRKIATDHSRGSRERKQLQGHERNRKASVRTSESDDAENDSLEKLTSIDTRASSHDNDLIKQARLHEKKLHDAIIEDRVEDGETVVAPKWFINPKDPRKIYWDRSSGCSNHCIRDRSSLANRTRRASNWRMGGLGYFIDIMFY